MYKIKAYQNKEIVSRHVSIDYNKRRNPDQKRRYQAEGQPVWEFIRELIDGDTLVHDRIIIYHTNDITGWIKSVSIVTYKA